MSAHQQSLALAMPKLFTEPEVIEKLEQFSALRDAQVDQLKTALIECSFELKMLHDAHPGPITRGRRRYIGNALQRAASVLRML